MCNCHDKDKDGKDRWAWGCQNCQSKLSKEKLEEMHGKLGDTSEKLRKT